MGIVIWFRRKCFSDNLEWSQDSDVYEHLLKLTSGLDSMVVGEEQIMTQIKDSIQSAKKLKVSGESLNTLFDKAYKCWY